MERNEPTLLPPTELLSESDRDSHSQPATAGYGACSACGCRGFKGKGGSTTTYICECGHHYSIHKG
jgi:hypothetical protein